MRSASVSRHPPHLRNAGLARRRSGRILAPWGTHYGNQDAVARLTVAPDGASAHGRFTGPVEFMKLRSQRPPFPGHERHVPDGVAGSRRSLTHVTETDLLGSGRFSAAAFAIGLRVRDCFHQAAPKRGGARPVWFYGLADQSWACVMFRDRESAADVYQSGPRSLWGEVHASLRWWRAHGGPGFERFGLTVTAEGRRAWVDRPTLSWDV